jgi:dihydroorotate dehydrogenase electron transfer subunit
MPLVARDARRAGLDVHWVHGARTAAELCREWDGDFVHWATDDGSRGVRGSALNALPDGVTQVLACGPNPMLAAVARMLPRAQVSLETYMGCGTGVCLGCAVPRTGGGYDRACSEGPIYVAGAVDWAAIPTHLGYAA